MSTNEEQLPELKRLREEFESESTTDARRAEIVERVVAMAGEHGTYDLRCVRCGKPPVFIPYDHALVKGHTYSEEGLSELRLSGMCEYCFDKMYENDEDYDGPPTGPQEA